MSVKRILFATDFSPLSRGAEKAAAHLARDLGADLEVFHAVAPFPTAARRDPALRKAAAELMREAAEKLQAAAARLRRHGVSPRARLVMAVPWQAVLDRAQDIRADLIVVGTHPAPKRGPGRFGTTSHRVVLLSRIPVLVVPKS